jgi:Flagellar protein YcgR/PilZ domain
MEGVDSFRSFFNLFLSGTGDHGSSEYFSGGASSLIIIAAILFCILLAFAITYLLLDSRTRKRMIEERWELFRHMCNDRVLSSEEISFLRGLQQEMVPDRPHLLVTSLKCFDQCVEQELYRLQTQGLAFQARSQAANTYVGIREKLFFGEALVVACINSSSDLHPHQPLRLAVEGTRGTYVSTVLEVSNSSLTISMPNNDGQAVELAQGDGVTVFLAVKNDAAYCFSTNVSGIRDTRVPAVHLWHTEKVGRQQVRTWLRMSMEVPCRFYRISLPNAASQADHEQIYPGDYGPVRREGRFTGIIRDFSLGGVCLRCEDSFEKGQYVGVLIPIFGPKSDLPEEEIEIFGRIVDSSEIDTTGNNLFNVHVQFVPLGEDVRSLLMSNMFQLQHRFGKTKR